MEERKSFSVAYKKH